MNYRVSFLILFIYSTDVFYASENKVTFTDPLEVIEQKKTVKVFKEPSLPYLKNNNFSLEEMHPCKGVCSCGCYIDTKHSFNRVCDIGIQPLRAVNFDDDEPVYFGYHCQDKARFEAWKLKDYYKALICLATPIFCSNDVYILGTCRTLPLIDDKGNETLQPSCIQRVGFDYKKIRSIYTISNQEFLDRVRIANPCQKVMK